MTLYTASLEDLNLRAFIRPFLDAVARRFARGSVKIAHVVSAQPGSRLQVGRVLLLFSIDQTIPARSPARLP
jgi:hypothetical protein